MLSREQNAMLQFKLQSIPFHEAIKKTKFEPLIALNDTLIDAVSWFGVSEHYARQADRSLIIKDSARAKQCSTLLQHHNKAGLEILSRVHPYLDELSKSFTKGKPPKENKYVKAGVAKSLGDLKAIVADFETKPSDVKKITDAIDQIDSIYTESGHTGVIRLLQQKLSELETLRSRPDRGAIENIPIWKAAAIIAAVGIWVIALIHCGWFGCSVNWATAYAIGFNIAALIVKFC